ncbi:MAG: hypothetical protein ACQER9_02340 [Nanobdellota archaeon]
MEDKAQSLYKEKNKKYDLGKDIEPYGMWAFCISLAPLSIIIGFWFLIPIFIFFPYISLILSFISLGKLKESPEQYKGRGFVIASIILASLQIVLEFIIMMFLSMFSAILF